MTLSSEQKALRGLDAMVIIYSLLEQHPASDACETYIRAHDNWFRQSHSLTY